MGCRGVDGFSFSWLTEGLGFGDSGWRFSGRERRPLSDWSYANLGVRTDAGGDGESNAFAALGVSGSGEVVRIGGVTVSLEIGEASFVIVCKVEVLALASRDKLSSLFDAEALR